MAWNETGSQLAVTTKGKKMHIFDPRKKESAVQFESFAGSKASKVFWVPNLNMIGATGFNKQAKRMLRLWDLKKLDSAPLYSERIDQMSSVLMPHMDNAQDVLFLAGKGDGSISYYQLRNTDSPVQLLSSFRESVPQKGGDWLPKRACDINEVEMQRYMKINGTTVVPISFRLDRRNKSYAVNMDIFKDCFSGLPSMTCEEYLAGEDKEPVTMSLDPAKKAEMGDNAKFVAKKTYVELSKENEELKARIAELEKQINAE